MQSATAEIRRGKKIERKKKEEDRKNTGQKYNGYGCHNQNKKYGASRIALKWCVLIC